MKTNSLSKTKDICKNVYSIQDRSCGGKATSGSKIDDVILCKLQLVGVYVLYIADYATNLLSEKQTIGKIDWKSEAENSFWNNIFASHSAFRQQNKSLSCVKCELFCFALRNKVNTVK